MAETDKHAAVFEVIEGPEGMKGRRIKHKGIPMIVGRAPQVDLLIPDPKISKNHAVIEKKADTYFIVDLDSKNGTVVNGERLLRPEGVKLRHGDEIQIGDARLRFYLFEGLEDAELQAIQKRINYNAIQKYSSRSAVVYCEIPDFRGLYTKYDVKDVDIIRDKFLGMFRDLVHDGAPYYAEPRGETAVACFETVASAFEFAKTLLRRLTQLNIALLRNPTASIKKIEVRVGLTAGPLSLIVDDDGRIEKVTGAPISTSRVLCEITASGELWLTENTYNDIPAPQRIGIEIVKQESKLGKLYRYLSDTTAYC